MNKKSSLLITAAMLVCFTTANADVAYVNATSESTVTQTQENAPAQEVNNQEQAPTQPVETLPPVVEPTVAQENAPVAVSAPTQVPAPTQVQNPTQTQVVTQNTTPIYYYTTPVTTQQTIPSNQIDDIRNTVNPKRTMHFGIIGEIGSTDYYANKYADDMENGLQWNAGLFASFPLTDHVVVAEIAAKFLHRNLSNTSSSYDSKRVSRKNAFNTGSIAIPLLMNFYMGRSEFFFAVGTQLEFPIYNNLQISFNGKKDVDENLSSDITSDISWYLDFGLGFNATKNFGVTFNITIGMNNLYNDLYIDDEYWTYRSVDLNLGIRIFL